MSLSIYSPTPSSLEAVALAKAESISTYYPTPSSSVPISLAKPDVEEISNNEQSFRNAIHQIQNRVTLTPGGAKDSLQPCREYKFREGSPLWKNINKDNFERLPQNAINRAREILNSSPEHFQAYTALQFASTLKAIRDLNGQWIKYDNEENTFSFRLEYGGEYFVGYINLDIEVPLMGSEEKVRAKMAEVAAKKTETEVAKAGAARRAAAAKEFASALKHFNRQSKAEPGFTETWVNRPDFDIAQGDLRTPEIYWLEAYYSAYPEASRAWNVPINARMLAWTGWGVGFERMMGWV